MSPHAEEFEKHMSHTVHPSSEMRYMQLGAVCGGILVMTMFNVTIARFVNGNFVVNGIM
jgi:hypothetical protein